MSKKLGGDRSRTADPNWPKGYSTPYGVMLNNTTGGCWLGEESVPLLGEWLAICQQVESNNCVVQHLLCLLFLLLLFFVFFCVCVCLFFFPFFDILPHSTALGGGVHEGLCGV